MKKIEKWVAEDGKEFRDSEECVNYEMGLRAESAFLAAHERPECVSTTELFQWVATTYYLAPKAPACAKD